MRTKSAAVVLLLALVAVACGGRQSTEQILAEQGGGSRFVGGGNALGNGDDLDGFGGFDVIDGLDGEMTDGAGTGSGTRGGTARRGGTSRSATGGNESAPPAPPGGNGGATDVGVTATEVLIGNVATISGSVPGLFRGALIGTQAFFAYQNSIGGLHGRQFRVISGDDAFNAGQHKARYAELKDKVFAFVGSFSLFDDNAAGEIESSGVLDLGRALSPARQAQATHQSVQPFQIGWPTTGCEWLKKRFKDVKADNGTPAIENMAIFWGNQDAARNNAAWQRASCEAVGFKFIYEREVQATESNFTADVAEMRRLDVQGLFFVFDVTGTIRFFNDMHAQGFDPPIKYPTPAAYDSAFLGANKGALEGIIIGQAMSMFLGQDSARVPEIDLFKTWLARIDPNQKVDLFAMYGWAAGRMLVEAMEATGPEASREKVNAYLQTVDGWTGNGLVSPQRVGAKKNGTCELYMIIEDHQFRRLDPAEGFICDGVFHPYDG